MKPLAPRLELTRFDVDTLVTIDANGDEIERWPRDRHWCVFSGNCPHCGVDLTPYTPAQFRRLTPLRPELCAHCAGCGDIWLPAVRTTLPI